MKVSIITVCYNAADTIEETIKSVLAQTYKNIEYIIIDGQSTDGTLGIIRRYRDQIAVVVSEKDCGIYDAMNKGIQAATGEIVFFLNADDVFYNEIIIEEIANVFIKHDIDILYGDVVLLDEEKTVIKRHSLLDKMYFLHNTICHQAVFSRARVFKQCGLFNTAFKLSADYEWLLRVLFKFQRRSLYVEVPIAVYNTKGRSGNKDLEGLLFAERKKIIDIYFHWLDLKIYSSKLYRCFINTTFLKPIVHMIMGWNL